MWYVISIFGFSVAGFALLGPMGFVLGLALGFGFGKMTTSARKISKMTEAEKKKYIEDAQKKARK